MLITHGLSNTEYAILGALVNGLPALMLVLYGLYRVRRLHRRGLSK
jgi:hypothetical protein